MIFYLRQSAVIQYDPSEKIWREELFCKSLEAAGHETMLVISDFDHYKKGKRKTNPLNKNTIFIKSLGYKSNKSLRRILDAVTFAINSFRFLRKKIKPNDVIIVAIPTPESIFSVALLRLFKKFTVIADYRDSWPRALNLKNRIVKSLFTAYVYILLKLSIPGIDKSIFMSQNLERYYSKYLGSAESIVLPNPITKFIHRADIEIKKQIMFIGSINDQFNFQLLDQLLNIKALREYEFVIYGDGYNLHKLRAQFSNSPRVCFKGSINYNIMLEKASQAKMFFIPFTNPSNYENHFSNKMSDLIGFGKPILTNLDNTIFNVGTATCDIGLNFDELELLKEEDLDLYLDDFKINLSGLEMDAFSKAIIDIIQK